MYVYVCMCDVCMCDVCMCDVCMCDVCTCVHACISTAVLFYFSGE